MLQKSLIMLASLALFACQESKSSSELKVETSAEPIFGFTWNQDSIDFLVGSTGCTGAANFSLIQLESFPPQLLLRKIKPDYCKAAPSIVSVNFPIGSDSGRILNPLQQEPKNFSCSTPVKLPIPGSADVLFLDASIEARFDTKICKGKGGYQLTGSASRNGGFVGFSDFEWISTQVCAQNALALQSLGLDTTASQASFQIQKIGLNGVEKASLTVEAGNMSGAHYSLDCQTID